jgi:hypothetical protein
MARVTFSPLISDCRGKTGPVVFSSWKGRPVVRELVTPANPNTHDQKAQRDIWRMVVAWWHGMPLDMRAAMKELAASEAVTGFNAFTKRNVRDLAMVPSPVDPRIFPLNTPIPPLGALTPEAGSSGRICNVSWTAPDPPNTHIVRAVAVEMDGEDFTGTLVEPVYELTASIDEEIALEMPKATQSYTIFLMQQIVNGFLFSTAMPAVATSGAES